VVWKNKNRGVGVRTHLGCNQEAHNAECATIARALEVAGRRRAVPIPITIDIPDMHVRAVPSAQSRGTAVPSNT